MHVTQLASGTINGADQLSIELREPDDAPATVWIIWPTQPTITDAKRLNITVNRVMAILARGVYAAPGDPGEAALDATKPRVSAPGLHHTTRVLSRATPLKS